MTPPVPEPTQHEAAIEAAKKAMRVYRHERESTRRARSIELYGHPGAVVSGVFPEPDAELRAGLAAYDAARSGEREETPFDPERARHVIEAVPASEIRAGDDIMSTDLIRRVHAVREHRESVAGVREGVAFDLGDRWQRYEDAEPVYRVRAARSGEAEGEDIAIDFLAAVAAPAGRLSLTKPPPTPEEVHRDADLIVRACRTARDALYGTPFAALAEYPEPRQAKGYSDTDVMRIIAYALRLGWNEGRKGEAIDHILGRQSEVIDGALRAEPRQGSTVDRACDKCHGKGWLCDECGAPMDGSCPTEGCAGDLASAHGCEHPKTGEREPADDARHITWDYGRRTLCGQHVTGDPGDFYLPLGKAPQTDEGGAWCWSCLQLQQEAGEAALARHPHQDVERELRAEISRLRGRTHEIAEAKDAEHAKAMRDYGRLREAIERAKERTANWQPSDTAVPSVTWSVYPGSWWSHSSHNSCMDVSALIVERDEALAEVERLRDLLLSIRRDTTRPHWLSRDQLHERIDTADDRGPA